MARMSPLEQAIAHDKPAVERILRAAVRGLSRRDSESLSMREIAAEARVSKSLLHYHFKSKDDLLLAVLDKFFDAMIARIEAVTERLERERSSETLSGSLDAIWAELRSTREMQPIVLRLAARGTLDDSVRQRLIRFRTRVVGITVKGLRRALGERAPADLEPAAELLLACLVGFEAGRLFADDERSLDRGFDHLRHLFQRFATSA